MTRQAAHPAQEGGFTLVEVLMVVFIIGLSAGLVVLTLPSRDSAQLTAAKSFVQDIQRVQDVAVLSGRPTGIRLSERGYDIVEWRNEVWSTSAGGRTFPASTRIEIRDDLVARPDDWPQLVFDPTTVNTAMSFRIRGRSERIDILVDEAGEVQIEQR